MKINLSIIIPVYNSKETLARSIRSINNQIIPLKNMKVEIIIVVDDGKSYKKIIPKIKKNFFIKIIKTSGIKTGPGNARNIGIKAAKSEWIAFLDSDDEWLPQKVEKQIVKISHNPSYKVVHCEEIWIRDGRRVNPKLKHKKYGGYIFEKCLPLCVISPSAVVIHRGLFQELGYFDESLPACEDYDFWLRYSAKEDVNFIDEPLIIKKGGHSDQLSGAHWGMDRFRIYSIEKILKEPDLKLVHKTEAIHEVILKLEILINGSQKLSLIHISEPTRPY